MKQQASKATFDHASNTSRLALAAMACDQVVLIISRVPLALEFGVFLITVVTWLYLQPALEQCTTLEVGWIAIMFFRNLGLLWLVYGGWHWTLYVRRVQGTDRKYDTRWPQHGVKRFLFGHASCRAFAVF